MSRAVGPFCGRENSAFGKLRFCSSFVDSRSATAKYCASTLLRRPMLSHAQLPKEWLEGHYCTRKRIAANIPSLFDLVQQPKQGINQML